MTEVEIKAVKMDGIVWLMNGPSLYMTDEEGKQFTPFSPGSETYGYKIKQLSKLKPIPESDRKKILSNLMNTIKELI